MRFLQRLARKENLLARIICLLMACGLWVYVMTDQNPIIERNIEVRLQQRNLPQNMMVFNAPDKILVKVRGSRAKLSSRICGYGKREKGSCHYTYRGRCER